MLDLPSDELDAFATIFGDEICPPRRLKLFDHSRCNVWTFRQMKSTSLRRNLPTKTAEIVRPEPLQCLDLPSDELDAFVTIFGDEICQPRRLKLLDQSRCNVLDLSSDELDVFATKFAPQDG